MELQTNLMMILLKLHCRDASEVGEMKLEPVRNLQETFYQVDDS